MIGSLRTSHEDTTAIVSICDLRLDLYEYSSNKEHPLQNSVGSCVPEVIALQKFHLGF